ncbi:hypothetical protein ABN034_00655 [Actinopolymorpha sp. B11F2]|uniref:hypothetical protein n=1 Tax=Actinopolymorpha sp. B11F2 TaxID=3160862 RepID=UPI0032E49C60
MTRPAPPPPLAWAMVVVFVVAMTAALLGIGVHATRGGHAAVDEPQYLLTALSLAEDGDLDISDELAAERWRAYFHDDLPTQTAPLEDGRELSPHDPLLPVLLAVPMRLGGFLAAKAALSAVAGAAAALSVWTAVRRFQVPLGLATSGVAVAFASPPLAVYGQQVYPELPAALAVVVAVAALTGRLGTRGLVVLVLAVTALPWLGVKYAPVAAALVLVALARLVLARRRQAVLGLTGGLLVSGITYLAAHQAIWGGWTVYASGDHFVDTGEFSVVGVAPDYVGRSLRLVSLFTDQAYGLAAWQPAWLLAVAALGALLAVRPRGWAALAVPLAAGWLVATYVALTMNGFWWPGRQVVVVLPLALVTVLWWLGRSPVGVRVVAGVPGLVGVLALVTLLVDGWAGEITWVAHFEGVDNPAYQILRVFLPDYRAGWSHFWIGHLIWCAVLVCLAAAGWSQARRRENAEAVHDETSHEDEDAAALTASTR